jgi:hypothetical protein
MNKFGVFAQLVAIAGSLASAAAAIRLAFMKRSKWQPPEEALPAAAARFALLLTMIVIALLYVFGASIGLIWLGVTTVVLFGTALASLTLAIKTNIKYSFYYPAEKIETNRRLGGDTLTAEAAKIHQENHLTEQKMFEDAQGDKDLVWTKDSQASINIRSTISFILLVGLGTCSLAAAAMLVAIFTGAARGT